MAVSTYSSSQPTWTRGNSPNLDVPIAQGFPFTAVTLSGNVTLTAAQVAAGMYVCDPGGGARTCTLPTAALLAALFIDRGLLVGQGIDLAVINTADGAETITVAVGTGITSVTGNVLTIAQNARKIFRLVATNLASGSEAFDLYNLTL